MKGDKYIVTGIGMSWYIVNTRNDRERRIGPVQLRGKNYYDAAKEEAGRRMGIPADEVEYVPNYFDQGYRERMRIKEATRRI